MRRHERVLCIAWSALAAGLAAGGCARTSPIAGPVVVVDIPSATPEAESAEPAPPHAPPPSSTILGRWEGTGQQASGASWGMSVDLVTLEPGVCGHVQYPTVPCAADWICTGISDGRSLRAREHLTEGRENCIDGGEMTMQLTADDHLRWRWTGSDETAKADLKRARGDVDRKSK